MKRNNYQINNRPNIFYIDLKHLDIQEKLEELFIEIIGKEFKYKQYRYFDGKSTLLIFDNAEELLLHPNKSDYQDVFKALKVYGVQVMILIQSKYLQDIKDAQFWDDRFEEIEILQLTNQKRNKRSLAIFIYDKIYERIPY